jgi:hypothetical protein
MTNNKSQDDGCGCMLILAVIGFLYLVGILHELRVIP